MLEDLLSVVKMVSLTFAVIGDPGLPRTLGKLGSHTDIEIYNRRIGERIYHFVYPRTFPDRLASLLNALAMADGVILVVNEVSPAFGEAIVAIDEYGIEKGLLILDGVVIEQIRPFIKGTVLEGYRIVEKGYAQVTDALEDFHIEPKVGSLRLPLDHFFLTKTIGTVGVGKVERGVIRMHDKLRALPIDTEVQVKSLQSQDVNMLEIGSGVRAGVALKGVEADELDRGVVLTDSPEDFLVSGKIKGSFKVNPFFKQTIEQGNMVQVTVGLQTETGRVIKMENGEIELELDGGKKLVYETGEPFILSRPELKGLRIVGSGRI